MKRLFPFMFAILFAGQVFAEEGVTASAEVTVNAETTEKAVATQGELAVEVVIDEEEAKAEAMAVITELKKQGLSDGQIVAVFEEALKNETTENMGRSTLNNNRREKLAFFGIGLLIGVVGTIATLFTIAKISKSAKRSGRSDGGFPPLDPETQTRLDEQLAERRRREEQEGQATAAAGGSGGEPHRGYFRRPEDGQQP